MKALKTRLAYAVVARLVLGVALAALADFQWTLFHLAARRDREPVPVNALPLRARASAVSGPP